MFEMRPLTRIQLDLVRCENGCNDHPIDLASKCHPDAPTYNFYDKKKGVLILHCAQCEKIVFSVQVEAGSVGDA